MTGMLALLLLPLAVLALVGLSDDSDPPDAAPPADHDDILDNSDVKDGAVDGGIGNDLIQLSGPQNPAYLLHGELPLRDQVESGNAVHVRWSFYDADKHEYRDWLVGTPWPEKGTPGVLAGLGGDGDDTLEGAGHGLHLRGDAGNDLIVLRPAEPGNSSGQPGTKWYSGSCADGGTGDDTLQSGVDNTVFMGGAGNDVIHVSSAGNLVMGNDGADRIRIEGATDSHFILDRLDVVSGRGQGDDGNSFHLGQGTSFVGNDGSDRIILDPGARADGGKGDDHLSTIQYLLPGDSSTLTGGEGNDTIIGNFSLWDDLSLPMRADEFKYHVGTTNDLLQGGDGDDLIRFDLSDTVSGGAGADDLGGFVQMDHTAVVTDFNPAEDVLRVFCKPTEIGTKFEHFGWREEDGATLITLGNQTVLRIEGATGLKIGFEDGLDDMDPATYRYTDIDGNIVTRDALDVIVNPYDVAHVLT